MGSFWATYLAFPQRRRIENQLREEFDPCCLQRPVGLTGLEMIPRPVRGAYHRALVSALCRGLVFERSVEKLNVDVIDSLEIAEYVYIESGLP